MMTDAPFPPGRPRLDDGGSDAGGEGPRLQRQASRRGGLRVTGPFDGRYVGPLPTPLRIHDLSAGGCLIECHYDVAVGRRFALQIELPGEGWITLDAETVRLRDSFGFAVRFVNVSQASHARIVRTIERLLIERSRSKGS